VLHVRVDVVDAHEDRVARRVLRGQAHALERGDHERAVAEEKLRAMLADAQPLARAEGTAQPCHRGADVAIVEHRKHPEVRHRAVLGEAHRGT
jgi:hypothetical protein